MAEINNCGDLPGAASYKAKDALAAGQMELKTSLVTISDLGEEAGWSSDQSSVSWEISDADWKTSTRHWDTSVWSRFFIFLHDNGYQLHTTDDFKPSKAYEKDPQSFVIDTKPHRQSFSPYDGLRTAHDMKRRNAKVYIKAILPKPASCEVAVLKMLQREQVRRDPRNHAIHILDILEITCEEVKIVFIVQTNGGWPLSDLNVNKMSTLAWRTLVLDCFEGLHFLHCHGIAHLDIGPTNILYDYRTKKPSFIDFEGCQLFAASQIRKTPGRRLIAVNARLPELGQLVIDPFAADVWELGDLFLHMKRFPDDDMTALFRFMAVRSPPARPTISYALDKLRSLVSYDSHQDF
ncbi:MAG: hypothetical protein CYPHOPRED_002165 [Cyphobasidiales sp. Tagirdzhanova-0007]|nr:MAG: hypothetical protein CYPHOPRED_002165 [Cyphobasidiales sp. Tagirdzhanova-0007]